jgi:hypothetical protein
MTDSNLLVDCWSLYDIKYWVVGVMSVELRSRGRVVVGCFVMELSLFDEASAQMAGICLMILVLGWA